MLRNFECGVVGFNSSWKTERITKDGECQTTEFQTRNVECFSNPSTSVHVQTDVDKPDIDNASSTIPKGLDAWLENIAPMMLKELSSTETSIFAKGYDLYSSDDGQENVAKLLQTLVPPNNNELILVNESTVTANNQQMDNNTKLAVSSLSWSRSGNSLAVGYGMLYHNDWCQHTAVVHIFIDSFIQESLKHVSELQVSSCVTDVKYNPTESNLIAASTVAGDIYLWNLQNPTVNFCKEHVPNRVSSILWLAPNQIQNCFPNVDAAVNQIFVSSCVRGSIVVWLVNKALLTMTKFKCYQLHGSSPVTSPPDISCIDFTKVKPFSSSNSSEMELFLSGIFVVGCKSGQIYLCQTSVDKFTAGSDNLDPYLSSLEAHKGCVLSMSFSSTNSLLVTLGTDMEIRLYNVPQESPIQILCLEMQLSCVTWTMSSDRYVVGTVGESNRNTKAVLQIFDVTTGEQVLSIDKQENSNETSQDMSHNLTTLAVNPKNINILAYGDTQGKSYVWKMPYKLF